MVDVISTIGSALKLIKGLYSLAKNVSEFFSTNVAAQNDLKAIGLAAKSAKDVYFANRDLIVAMVSCDNLFCVRFRLFSQAARVDNYGATIELLLKRTGDSSSHALDQQASQLTEGTAVAPNVKRSLEELSAQLTAAKDLILRNHLPATCTTTVAKYMWVAQQIRKQVN